MADTEWSQQPDATTTKSNGGGYESNGAGGEGGRWQSQSSPRMREDREDESRDRERERDSRGDRDRERSRRNASPGRGGGEDDRGRGSGENNPGNNLHVSSLSAKVDDAELEEEFGKYGRVTKAQVMRDPHSKESRRFGFVTMSTPEEAEAAIAALNGYELQGTAMTVAKARRGRARTPTPGQYHGPPKRDANYRPYEPRGGYDDRDRRYDSYRDSRSSRYGGSDIHAVPMRGGGGDRDYDRRDRDYDRRDRDYDRRDRDYDRRGGGGDRYDDRDRDRRRY